MRRFLLVISFLSSLAIPLFGQAEAGKSAAANVAALEAVLTQMDTAAANFRTAQADFVWDQYQKVVDETDSQKGTMYFRRERREVEMAADIADPEKKYVLFSDGKVRVYQPRIDQVTEYDAGKNRADFESFLVLGFGGRGHDLSKSFQVRHAGTEAVDGVNTAKLELTPRSQRVRGMFELITLWIDPQRGVSLQQKFIEPSGDYRLARYSNIKLNQGLPSDVFKLKTTGRTRVVRPQG
jgi:outer membrane lipoprotein-sorting protein